MQPLTCTYFYYLYQILSNYFNGNTRNSSLIISVNIPQKEQIQVIGLERIFLTQWIYSFPPCEPYEEPGDYIYTYILLLAVVGIEDLSAVMTGKMYLNI